MSSTQNILVTGGAGYIGSHTVVELLKTTAHKVTIFDNFSNASHKVIDRIQSLGGRAVDLQEGDLTNVDALEDLFASGAYDSVIHFAGLKAVGESVAQPLRYYETNVGGTLKLLHAMTKHGCRKMVFSSSATVYGDPDTVPIVESAKLSATNPYGQTKLMVEEILRDLSASDAVWQIAILRYFNPIAAHKSGQIGEDPKGIPNNLLPYIAQVAAGRRDQVTVHGDDYDTGDGTGIRDYIHVVDLADAHLAALEFLQGGVGCQAINIGTGSGYSVFEMLDEFRKVSGQKIPHAVGPRRPGDIASCYADASRAKELLEWSAQYGLTQMIEDHWRWQSNNPNGYE